MEGGSPVSALVRNGGPDRTGIVCDVGNAEAGRESKDEGGAEGGAEEDNEEGTPNCMFGRREAGGMIR